MAQHSGDFIAYYRVSTAGQGKSGLGLEAQEVAVKSYLNGGEWHIVASFTETESGKRNARPQLAAALAAARLHRVPLIVANVSRLTRSSYFLSQLLEAGVDVLFCDLPKLEGPTGRFLLRQMASVAELEADFISDRTKKALAAFKVRESKKPKGQRRTLGGKRRTKLTDDARALGRAVIAGRASEHAANMASTIAKLQAAGVTTLQGIAAALNEQQIPTASGNGQWQAVQVARVLARIG
jgi:DNA invertase Pin-like site-specific DNA recombinase